MLVYTFRQGVAAGVGHDLVLEATTWSADITVGDDETASVEATVDLSSLVVREGRGGVKPLSDRDRREIAHNARTILDTDHFRDARFSSTTVSRNAIDGELTVRGTTRPFTLELSEDKPDHYTAKGSLLQTDFGIKPYTAFFGALKLADRVEIGVEVDVSGMSG